MDRKADVEALLRDELLSRASGNIEGDIDDIPFTSLGIDSLEFFEIVYRIEEEFSIELSVDQLKDEITLRTLVEIVTK